MIVSLRSWLPWKPEASKFVGLWNLTFCLNMPFSVLFSILGVTLVDNAKLLLWIDKWNPSCFQGMFCGCVILTCHGGSIHYGVSEASQALPAFPTPYGRLRMALPAFLVYISIITFTCFSYQEESSRAVILVVIAEWAEGCWLFFSRSQHSACHSQEKCQTLFPSQLNEGWHFTDLRDPVNLMTTLGDFCLPSSENLVRSYNTERMLEMDSSWEGDNPLGPRAYP